MKIKDLLSALGEYEQPVQEQAQQEVSGLTDSAQDVQAGFVFVAIRGQHRDGHQLIPQAIEQGAIAIVYQDELASLPQVTSLRVSNSRQALSLLACRFHGDPARKLLAFGVTGTNGKTSCTYMMEHILNGAGLTCAVIGTIDHHLQDMQWPTRMTSPHPLTLQARLQEMRGFGAKSLAMEVSSHALDQHRVDGIAFNTVLFTNLSRDHLDYHQSFENYFQAKQRLFTEIMWSWRKPVAYSVVNIDDSWGRRLRLCGQIHPLTYGQNSSDFQFELGRQTFSSMEYTVKTPMGVFSSELPLFGAYNLYNAVGCLASALTFGVSLPHSMERMKTFPGTPGRMQKIPNARGVHIFVDYAHTPDAIAKAAATLRQVREQTEPQAKLHIVFGCGGERDVGKRPQMLRAAEQLSDQVFVTSDNPRSEDPEKIIADILVAKTHSGTRAIVDRAQAIKEAIAHAKAGDIVLIAGKGHENYQEIGKERLPFDDRRVAKEN